jgi:ribonuclease I
MTNPLVHALVFLAAVLIPGGLLVYFAWRAISLKRVPNHTAENPGSENIPDTLSPTPDEAQSAFREMFPKDSPDSVRARRKGVRLGRVRAFRHRKFKK